MTSTLTEIFGGILGIILVAGGLAWLFYQSYKDRQHYDEYHKHIADCCDSMKKYFDKKED